LTGQDELLFHSDEVDPAYNVYWGDNTTRLRGVAFDTDHLHISYIDPKDAALAKQIDTALPNTINQISSASTDETKLIIRAYSRSSPDAYYLFDRSARRISPLGSAHPGLDPKQLGASHFLRFPARDGLPLTATLLLPPTADTPPPVIVFAGFDFTTRISPEFDPILQLLASRGYAVLQVNHRGVDGFGKKHALAGNGEIDGKMCDDLADGIGYAIQQGLVDGKRVAIWGNGFEGILGLFTLARHPDLFAAWINFNTPLTTTYWNPEYFVFGLHEKDGNSLPVSLESKTWAYMRKLAPTNRLKEIKVPSFLYYEDPIYDGSEIEKTLRKNGVPVIFVTPPTRLSRPADYAGEWKQVVEDKDRCFGELLKFLATCLPTPANSAAVTPPAK
jgi:dipeptidyl aminopeptidase/acylaminoacyl peptidase